MFTSLSCVNQILL